MLVKKEILNDEINDLLSNMALVSSYVKKAEEIVVRGGILYCRAGTHYRYLNISSGDRANIKGSPVALKSDCRCGENICDFGLCAIKTAQAKSTDNFVNINEIPGTIRTSVINRGIPCTFVPVGTWEDIDELSLSWNSEKLAMEGELTTSSIQKCSSNESVAIKSAGQENSSSKKDTLEDHDICDYEVKADDPIQVKIAENKITIHVFIEYTNADDRRKKLIREGIKKWENKKGYKYVYGHKAELEIVLDEIDIESKNETKNLLQKRVKIICEKEENCSEKAMDVNPNLLEAEERSHTWNDPNHTKKTGIWDYDYAEIHLFPIEAKPRMKTIFGVVTKTIETKEITVTDKDGIENKVKINICDIREVTDAEYVNIVAHEFGHAMGLPDNYNYGAEIRNLIFHGAYKQDDIMATDNYAKAFKCYTVDIQMIIGAAHKRMQQFYSNYSSMEMVDGTRYKCTDKV